MLLVSSKIIAAGLATVSIAGSGVGIGFVFGCFVYAVADNPGMTKQLFNYAIMGFALTEAVALFGLLMAFYFYMS